MGCDKHKKVLAGTCVKIAITGINGYHIEEVIYYRYNLNVDFATKWKWYFRYIAALVQVNNPRRKVELYIGPQGDVLCGQDYIDPKSKSLLKAKTSQLKKLEKTIVQDDLFNLTSHDHETKKQRVKEEINALERGEFNYYVFPTYINKIKKWITK